MHYIKMTLIEYTITFLCENGSYATSGQLSYWLACASASYDKKLPCPLMTSGSLARLNWPAWLLTRCTIAQAGLELSWLHKADNPFSHYVGHMVYIKEWQLHKRKWFLKHFRWKSMIIKLVLFLVDYKYQVIYKNKYTGKCSL